MVCWMNERVGYRMAAMAHRQPRAACPHSAPQRSQQVNARFADVSPLETEAEFADKDVSVRKELSVGKRGWAKVPGPPIRSRGMAKVGRRSDEC